MFRIAELLVVVSLLNSAIIAAPELYINGSPADSFVGITVEEHLTVQAYSDSPWYGYLIVESPDETDVTWTNPSPAEFAQVYSEAGWGSGYAIRGQAGTWHSADAYPDIGYCVISLWDANEGYDVPADYFLLYSGGTPGRRSS